MVSTILEKTANLNIRFWNSCYLCFPREKLEKQKKEIEHLQMVLDAKEELEKKQIGK